MAMLCAHEILPAGRWAAETAADHISLDFNERHRRRFRYVALGGTEFLLDLPRATVLQHGDGLQLTDGRIVRVDAADEALTEIRARNISELVRLAEKLTGHTATAVGFATEAPFLQALGMETIVMGPGSIDRAHQPDEYLELNQIQPCVDLLQQCIARYCL